MTHEVCKTNDSESDGMLSRYKRAEALEQSSYSESMVRNADVYPRWISGRDQFWYTRSNNGFIEYRIFDAKSATSALAFDQQKMAAVFTQATNTKVSDGDLSIDAIDIIEGCLTMTAYGKCWTFDREESLLESTELPKDHWLVSPDGQKAAFVQDYNLWIKCLSSGEEVAITQDGCQNYAYALQPESRDLLGDMLNPILMMKPEAIWAPDSKKLFTYQLDERQVRDLPTMRFVSRRDDVGPRSFNRKCALPGDPDVARFRLVTIDVDSAVQTAVQHPPIEDSFIWSCPFSGNLAWWSIDSRQAWFVDMTRGQKIARLMSVDTTTGDARCLFEEASDTFIDLSPDYEYPSILKCLQASNELLWFSERSGWGHLYLYDLSDGELKTVVTSGEWVVRDLLHLDEEKRELLIQIAGRDPKKNPYYREVAKVNIDTGDLSVVLASNHDLIVRNQASQGYGVSPCGNFIVATKARVDSAPVTELFNRDGSNIATVESADLSELPGNWQWPESFSVKADDGETDIYGVLFRPSDFDPEKKYPILDFSIITSFYSVMPVGAFLQGGRAGPAGCNPVGNHLFMTLSALAELGFIVVVMDGRGTLYRSKEFHNFGYASFMEAGGIVDHVAGVKQLAKKYAFMDLDRVGLVSTDAPGNGSVFGLLKFPEFYKVGVAFSIWDPRLVKQGEVHMGILDPGAQRQDVWGSEVQHLKGKLLLIAGLLDPYFHGSMTFQLVDELVKANKDFDLVIQPYGGHGGRVQNAHRRVWDYLVRHLLGEEPPVEFKLSTAAELACPELMPEMEPPG